MQFTHPHAPPFLLRQRKEIQGVIVSTRPVAVSIQRVGGQVWVQINWQTGANDQLWYKRSVRSYAAFPDAQALEQRIRDLNAAGLMDAQIAATLTTEGYQTPRLAHPDTAQNGLAPA